MNIISILFANHKRRAISLFLFLTLLISCIFWFLFYHSGSYYLYMTGLMWTPAISGILTRIIFKEPMSEFGLNWGKPKVILLSYLFPLGYLMLAYVLIWILGLGYLNIEELNKISTNLGIHSNVAGFAVFVILLGLFGSGSFLFAAAGEEIGWRGFLLKKILENNNSPIKSSLVVGVIWALWHFPLFHISGFTISVDNWMPLTIFFLMVCSLSFIYTWFFLKSKNIWPCILLHTSHNMFLQGFFTRVTKENELTTYFADETGLMIMSIVLMIAIVILFRFKNYKSLQNEK